ncbi:cytochrome b [Burkholderia multivorans]|uniref:cytochrome b n=1 Tax=Burkholderia multivorans TaxID=87883 RepID=UPI002863D32F|nr:cytochrome b [Burkholderia multivorans]MDR9332189.1 Cytochrome b561 [Burkholderia multivorans]
MMKASTTFSLPARVLHWVMAAMVLTMLFVGVGMVASVSERHDFLVALHKPLGVAVLVLVCVRIVVRLSSKPPALPDDLPWWQKVAAHGSHLVLYALMVVMPLIGWAMLSAGGYPVTFAWLRVAHRVLAYLFFLTFLAHFGAALYHGLIRRDGVLRAMVGR